MSVDWNDCESCGTSMCDCRDDHNICVYCGRYLCNGCLVKPKEYDDNDEMSKECCPYCSGAEVHNDDLLKFLLDHYNLTLEYAKQVYRESKGG